MVKPQAKRLQRLDRFLSRLEANDDALLLSELDGFIAGIVVCPELIMPSDWLPIVWGNSGPAFETDRQVEEAIDLIMGHYNGVVRSLATPGKYEPILEQDRDGSLIWELWASGFRKAIHLRRGAWLAFTDADDIKIRKALFSLIRIADIADGEGAASDDLDKLLREHAPDFIGSSIETLHHARLALHTSAPGAIRPANKAVGRNDPCPCGSGKKFKKCCLN